LGAWPLVSKIVVLVYLKEFTQPATCFPVSEYHNNHKYKLFITWQT
jgi:hypothetical protein